VSSSRWRKRLLTDIVYGIYHLNLYGSGIFHRQHATGIQFSGVYLKLTSPSLTLACVETANRPIESGAAQQVCWQAFWPWQRSKFQSQWGGGGTSQQKAERACAAASFAWLLSVNADSRSSRQPHRTRLRNIASWRIPAIQVICSDWPWATTTCSAFFQFFHQLTDP